MTTIVYRDGVLAADGLVTAGPLIMSGNATKIVRSPSGALGGACGSAAFCENWNAWVVAGTEGDPPERDRGDREDGGDMGLLIHTDARVEMFEHNGSYFPVGDYFADGAGSAVAMGAFFVGATAEQAIRAAMAHDICTGGIPTILRLDGPPAAGSVPREDK